MDNAPKMVNLQPLRIGIVKNGFTVVQGTDEDEPVHVFESADSLIAWIRPWAVAMQQHQMGPREEDDELISTMEKLFQ